jgi:hypothetical protein
LYDHIVRAGRLGIDVDFEIELEHVSAGVLECDCYMKIVLMDKLFEEVICKVMDNKFEKRVYLDIFDESDNMYIVFSNNGHDVLNEDDSAVCSSGVSCEAMEAMELAKEAGIDSSCVVDGDVITAKIWFHC